MINKSKKIMEIFYKFIRTKVDVLYSKQCHWPNLYVFPFFYSALYTILLSSHANISFSFKTLSVSLDGLIYRLCQLRITLIRLETSFLVYKKKFTVFSLTVIFSQVFTWRKKDTVIIISSQLTNNSKKIFMNPYL